MAAKRAALVAMCLVAFFSYLGVGMLAPFLPQHLKAIGISERWSGIIFAVYSIAMIAVTPLCNHLVARHGRVPLIGIGLLMQAVSTFAFGRLNGSLVAMLLSRALQGCGASASNLAMFALVADLFEDSLGRVMGLSEVVIGAGFSIGPLAGALLYEQGGFPEPFIVCSVILVVIAAMIPLLLGLRDSPAGAAAADGEPAPSKAQGSAFSRLWAACTWRLLAPAGLLIQGTMVWGVIDSGFYTVHAANELGLSQSAIGVNLAFASGAYSAIGLVAGHVGDRIGYGRTMLLGALTSATSLVLLGPVAAPAAEAIGDLIGSDRLIDIQRWYECGMLVSMGFGQAFMLVPSLGAMKAGVASGDAAATEACVSLFNTFQQAGLVLGPLESSAMGGHYALGMTAVASAIVGYATIAGPQLRRPTMQRGDGSGESLLQRVPPPSPMVSPFSPMSLRTPPERRSTFDGSEPLSKLVI